MNALVHIPRNADDLTHLFIEEPVKLKIFGGNHQYKLTKYFRSSDIYFRFFPKIALLVPKGMKYSRLYLEEFIRKQEYKLNI